MKVITGELKAWNDILESDESCMSQQDFMRTHRSKHTQE